MNILNRSVELINPPDYKTLLSNVEQAARNCYRSQDKITDNSAEGMIRGLLARHHDSPLEFVDLEFMIVGDRSFLAQWSRHRLMSLAVESQRFCSYNKDKFGNNVNFIVPCDITNDTYETWRASCLASESAYFVLLEQGAKPETARSVLPNCVATHIVCKMNMRELRHILELRLDTHSQSDIRDIAYKMLALVYEKYPVFVEDLVNKYGREYMKRKFKIETGKPFKFIPKSYLITEDGNTNKALNQICNKVAFMYNNDGSIVYDKGNCSEEFLDIIVRSVINNVISVELPCQ